ncbi:glycosyltransferase family 2 protein [Rhodanobacter ginsenosidimutans]|uniref:Glycosyltransferase n=1 Tax=Rhodanobacter ginsenosidimutans TaxID=490571 RepID=A0ABW0JWR2_9GAMM
MTTHMTSEPTTVESAEAPSCWLSVIIPTHNRRELTLRAVNSILEQHHPRRIEIIVVDDGSTDGLADAIHQRYAANDSVRVITTAREYTNAARNTGFRASCGELVCFLDSDDLWLAHTLTVVEQIFAEHPELAFLSVEGSTLPSPTHPLISRVVSEDAPGWSHAGFHSAPLVHRSLTLDGPQRHATLLYGDYFPAIIRGDLFLLSGLIIRRDAIVRAGPFTEHFRFYNDWEFFARMCLQGVGGYIDYDGFRRDAGRGDQISRARPATAMPRRHVYILRTLARRFPARLAAYANLHKDALNDAQYWMARCLLHTHHRRFAKRLLMHCVRQRYKVARSLALLAVADFI